MRTPISHFKSLAVRVIPIFTTWNYSAGWLPRGILQAMIENFQAFVHQQLVILHDPANASPGHTYDPSRESNMRIETASSGVSIPVPEGDSQAGYNHIIKTWPASLPSYYDQITTICYREGSLPDN